MRSILVCLSALLFATSATLAADVFSTTGTLARRIRASYNQPSHCDIGDLFQDADASTGAQVLACEHGSWVPIGSAAAGATPVYGFTFVALQSFTITGATHAIPTSDLTVDCWDSSDPRARVEPDSVTVDQTTHDVVVSFYASQSGRCVIR